jgi:CRISPR system Cascade subunit CasB
LTIYNQDTKRSAVALLTYFRQLKNDRGAMADLRRALNPNQRSRAWPLLARVDGIDNRVIETVAGLFAYHPNETSTGNLGSTIRELAEDKASFDGRFRRLLSCDLAEICKRIRPIIFAAKAEGVPVNYEQLVVDLRCWGDKVKAQWARQYWGTSNERLPAAVSESNG